MERWDDALVAFEAADPAVEDDYATACTAVEEAEGEHTRAKADFDKREAFEEAKRALPVKPVETPDVQVVAENDLTYRQGGPHSYFRDLADRKQGDHAASERLAHHAREVRDNNHPEVRRRDQASQARTAQKAERGSGRSDMDPWAQQRAINITDGSGGEFVPPLWLQDRWIPLQRAGRPIANTLNLQPLPPNTDTINLPKVTGGSAVAVQTDGGAVTATDLTTNSVTGAVQTVAGQQDASVQLVDLSIPGIDVVIFDDIARAYATKLDVLVITGAVTNAKGINQLASTNAVTYTQATPTLGTLYPKVADGIQRIHTTVFRPPQIVAMHPRRWGNVLASLDSQNRPLVVPEGGAFNQAAIFEDVLSENVVGAIQGLPIVVDASIPTTLGASTNQDQVYVYRADEMYLYESAPRLRVFEEVLSGNLQVRFQIYGYYSVILGRLPGAISVIDGTGLVAPTF